MPTLPGYGLAIAPRTPIPATRPRRATLGVLAVALLAFVAASPASATTIAVDETTDEVNSDIDCSLREAIEAANTNAIVDGCTAGEVGPALDTITLVPATTYTLAIPPGGSPDDNQDGDLDVASGGPLLIDGGDGLRPTIDGDEVDRVLDVTPNAALTLDGVQVIAGRTTASGDDGAGGGVRVRFGSSLDVIGSRFEANEADASSGGAIGTASPAGTSVTITGSELISNHAGENGGAVFGEGPLSVSGTSFDGNEAAGEGGGAIYALGGLPLAIDGSDFHNNHATGAFGVGGAIKISTLQVGPFSIERSHLQLNSAVHGGAIHHEAGGKLAIDATTIEDNDATATTGLVTGGGISAGSGGLELTSSVLDGNVAESPDGPSRGGGIYQDSGADETTIQDSLLLGNQSNSQAASAVTGGGISVFSGDLRIERSTLANNSITNVGTTTKQGGGIGMVGPGALLALNTTFSGNQVIGDQGVGGGIFSSPGPATLIHVTFAANQATFGDALRHGGGEAPSLRGSVVTGPELADVCSGPLVSTPVSGGGNVATGTTCALTASTDTQGLASAGLASLAANGGLIAGSPGFGRRVSTHALAAGSPAIDHVANSACRDDAGALLATDARGVVRPLGSGCDAGAYERVTAPETTITKRPKRRVKTRKRRARVRFRFESSEPGSSFECKLRGKGVRKKLRKWRGCESPRRYKLKAKPKARKYVFRVRATGKANNTDPTPAKRRFKVKRKT